MKRPAVLIPLVLFAALLAWLFWPLGSDEFAIEHDPEQVAAHDAYLESVSTLFSSTPDTMTPPNFVLLLADDLGLTDVSHYGGKQVSTPHIDHIGRSGVTFSDGYVSSPVCSPSRAGLLTGRYQQRFGYRRQKHEVYLKNRAQYLGFKYLVKSDPWFPRWREKVPRPEDVARQGLPPDEITIAELLQARGYATGIVGKWHLGAAEFCRPCKRGFDEQYGFYNSHSLYAPEGTAGIIDTRIPEDFSDKYIWKGQRDGECAIMRDCGVIEEQRYLTDAIADEAIEFINRHESEPFFLYVPFSAPHTPLQVPERLWERFSHIEDPYRRTYNAMIAALDSAVGRIVGELERRGLTENTLIVFLSDNGGATYTLTTDNAPLKGGKITDFEGGIRVPFLMRWDSVLPKGRTYMEPVISLDLYSTFAELAGVPLPADRVIDGVNLTPFLRDSLEAVPHDALYWEKGVARAIRAGDRKLMMLDRPGDTLLFDLRDDPEERRNLASSAPELVSELAALHADWMRDLPPPLWPGVVWFRYSDDQGTYWFEN